MEYDYDVVFLGGGAAGLFGASVSNTLGAKTCVIEKKRLGGDCTWFGCMPSKALLKSAYVAHLAKNIENYGLKVEGEFNIKADGVMSKVRDIIGEISGHHTAKSFEDKGIHIIIGAPRFIGEDTLRVNDQKITAKKFILCTGSHPVVLPIEGLSAIDYLTNENIFDLENLPESLIVLGGGPIGIELAQALNRLGVKVSVVEMMDRILFREDKDIASVLEKRLVDEGVKLYTGRKAVKFEQKQEKIFAVLEDKHKEKEEICAQQVLVAIGRAPNVEGLDLENAGVKYSKKGMDVNTYLQTSNKKIFACGDIVGPYMFSHVAAYQASVCVRNALFQRVAWQKVNYSNVAWATFTDPEISHLGLLEEEAKEQYSQINVYTNDYSSVDRATTDSVKEGYIKIITDREGYLLGAHIAGANAGEIIQGFLIAKSLKIPIEKLSQILYIYPTLSELVKKTAAKPLVKKMDNPIIRMLLKLLKKK